MENSQFPYRLKPCLTPGASISVTATGGWRLEIPPGTSEQYRLAQLDNYSGLPRQDMPHNARLRLQLRARACSNSLPGTWGFGLWNDPFSFSLGFGGGARRFPALPNTAWFFFASQDNYLSFRDDQPAHGNLASTFRSPVWPTPLLALGAPALALAAFPAIARQLRRIARRFIQESAIHFPVGVSEWHTYCLEWQTNRVVFLLDGDLLLETAIAPTGPLGLVIWIDNQYAAFPPNGRLSFGRLPNPEKSWMEIGNLVLEG